MGTYEPPVDQFLTRGAGRYGQEDWSEYGSIGIGPDQIPDLIRMVADEELNRAETNSVAVWAPLHAWRALAMLRAEEAIPTLVALLEQDRETFDDYTSDEVPKALGMIGTAALPALTGLMDNTSADFSARNAAVRAIGEVGKRHPEARDEAVSLLVRRLERAEGTDPSLNGFIVWGLVDLEAVEAAPAIERAFAQDLVDDSISGTWYEVWHDLELEGEPPPRTERRHPTIGKEILEALAKLSESRVRPEEQSANIRQPQDRKERNKARKKLESKAKKGGKRR